LKAQAEKEVQALHDKAAGVQADSTSKINKLGRGGPGPLGEWTPHTHPPDNRRGSMPSSCQRSESPLLLPPNYPTCSFIASCAHYRPGSHQWQGFSISNGGIIYI